MRQEFVSVLLLIDCGGRPCLEFVIGSSSSPFNPLALFAMLREGAGSGWCGGRVLGRGKGESCKRYLGPEPPDPHLGVLKSYSKHSLAIADYLARMGGKEASPQKTGLGSRPPPPPQNSAEPLGSAGGFCRTFRIVENLLIQKNPHTEAQRFCRTLGFCRPSVSDPANSSPKGKTQLANYCEPTKTPPPPPLKPPPLRFPSSARIG